MDALNAVEFSFHKWNYVRHSSHCPTVLPSFVTILLLKHHFELFSVLGKTY